MGNMRIGIPIIIKIKKLIKERKLKINKSLLSAILKLDNLKDMNLTFTTINELRRIIING